MLLAGGTTSAGHRVAAALLVSVGMVALSPPAQAHITLVSSSPVDGAVLLAAPTEVVLTFSEDALSGATVIALAGPDGAPVSVEPTVVRGPVVSAGLPPLPDPGTYTAAYRVVSGDGHPVTGQIRFAVGDESDVSAQVPTSTSASGLVTGAIVIVGGLALLAMIAVAYARRAGLRSDDT